MERIKKKGAEINIAKELLRMGRSIDVVLEELFPPDQSGKDFLTGAFYHHMKSGGKRIRPALCLLVCREMGGETSNALYFASAVEILHNMFLVHDDLQDGDKIRRDVPAVWVKYGMSNAVNLGDYMLGRAYAAILRSPVDSDVKCRLMQVFTSTFENTCRGQALDLNWRGRADMNVINYMKMVQLKTADYLVLGMVGGAVAAGAGSDVLDSVKKLGRYMGPAFQIRDDVIDLTCGKGRGGEIGNDIREGKPSILFAHAMENASCEEKKTLLAIIRQKREKTKPGDVEKIIDLYEQCGSLQFANEKARELTEKACEAVEDIPVENKDIFRRIVNFMAQRTT